LKTCDAADGLEDGQIADPRQCSFNPAMLQCKGADADDCLTPQQVAATAAIYNGPKGASGYARGSEANWITTWNANTQLQSGSYYDFFRLVAKQDPAWEFLTLDWPRDIDDARSKFGGIYNAVNPDLSAFKARGGKLIMYHGWSDALVPAGGTVTAWNRMNSKMGADSMSAFARLFMVPGMGHCAGGPIGSADWLTALERWVERGLPPDATPSTYTLLGSGKIDGVARTRPYCPYPKVARYRGAGDINTPESFICAAS
jgi:feruloyl esterase